MSEVNNTKLNQENQDSKTKQVVYQNSSKKTQLLGGYNNISFPAAAEVEKYLATIIKDFKDLKLINYQKQVVNGWNHNLTYLDKQGNKRQFNIFQDTEGGYQLMFDSKSSNNQQENSSQVKNISEKNQAKKAQQNKIPSARLNETSRPVVNSTNIDFKSAEMLQNYLKTIFKDFNEWHLVQYTKQASDGWNHTLIYQNKQGRKRKCCVYESLDGKFNLSSFDRKPASVIQHNINVPKKLQSTQPKIESKPYSINQPIKQFVQERPQDFKLGGYEKTDVSKAAPVQKFLETVEKDIKSFKLIKYERQVVNGWNHSLTYSDKQGKQRKFIVYETHDGKFILNYDSSKP